MMLRAVFGILISMICGQLLPAQTLYVKSGALGNGTSWADASGDLRAILNNANAGAEIWVAAGTYYPTQCITCTKEDRDVSFEISDSIKIYGGFLGNETALNQRDWKVNLTILNGDIDRDGTLANNTNTIVYFERVSTSTTIDGFSIINGYAYSPGDSDGERRNSGAAIFNQGGLTGSASHPNIVHCTFSNNEALGFGGAIYNNGSFSGHASPILEDCTFSNNISGKGGGAMFNQASFSGITKPIYQDCIFLNNKVIENNGGAVYSQGSESGDATPSFSNCRFEGNTSPDYGGAIHNHGRKGKSDATFMACTFINNEALFGGAFSSNGTLFGQANAAFTECLFEQNHAMADGGGIFSWGSDGGLSNMTLLDCTFKKNRSDFAGAGLFNNGIDGTTDASITNCKFIENIATTYGGAVYNNGKRGSASAIITNCLFQKNSGNSAGAIYNLGSENGNSSPLITNCTFFGNTANVGAAVYNNASDSTGTSNPIITNCIFWKNKANFGNVFRNILATPLIQYSVVDQPDCNSMNSGIGSNVACGTGVLYEIYPDFEDTLTGDFRLKSTSPLLDMGDNAAIEATGVNFDLDYNIRIFNDQVDLGAFEYFDDYVAPSITNQPQEATLCVQEMLALTITATGTPPLSYQWLKNGQAIIDATATSFMIPVTDVDDTGMYTCQVTGAEGEILMSDAVDVLIEPLTTPSITIETATLEICQGAILELGTSVLNEGDTPVFTWFLNNNSLNEETSSIMLDNLEDGDELKVALTSSLNCAQPTSVSDSVQISVLDVLNPVVNVSGPDTLVCIGQEARFEASFMDQGTNPSIQWLVNGILQVGQDEHVFVSNTLDSSDVIICQLSVVEDCANSNVVISNEVVVALEDCSFTSTLELLDNTRIMLHPNPSEGSFDLTFKDLEGAYIVDVITSTGQLHKSFMMDVNTANYSFPLTISDTGIYFIKTYNSQALNIQKIVIH